MQLSRSVTLIIHFVLDQVLPPFLRDSHFLFQPLFRILFGRDGELLSNFKKNAATMSEAEYRHAYGRIAKHNINRPTDLNDACIHRIVDEVAGPRVLDVGCGTGFLADLLSKKCIVEAVDISVDQATRTLYPNVKFHESFAHRLPFEDASFDTVVCTHTLEHVPDVRATVEELRRVSRTRLIIVVPCQRPYLYTFDLHLHFFPYPHSFILQAGPPKNRFQCVAVGGDLYYQEDTSRT